MKVVVTGNRLQKFGYSNTDLHDRLKNTIEANLDMVLKPTVVYTGMATGVDQWVAEICIKRMIPFIAVIPFRNQDAAWPRDVKSHYRALLKKAWDIVVVDEVESPHKCTLVPEGLYHPAKMMARNKWMIDQLSVEEKDEVLTCYHLDHIKAGGTRDTLLYVRKEKPKMWVNAISVKDNKIIAKRETAGFLYF